MRAMPEKRRKFSSQYKAEAVQMVLDSGKPVAVVARELGIHEGTLGNWVAAWRASTSKDKSMTPVEAAQMKELEEENRRLRMENEFLKKPRPSSPGRNRR